jgi:cell pole-organizing protein PopZ
MSDKPRDMAEISPEPSMEEILASIKRVIAEDGRGAAARPARGSRPVEAPPNAARADEEDEEDVLELSDELSQGEPLISNDAAAASRHSLAALSVLKERSEILPTGDGPLEAVVREMLKPILKDWLDRNLPEIVEELVTREIARIVGKSL